MDPTITPTPDPTGAPTGSDQYATLKAAVQGATQLGSPTSPLGSFPELAKLYSSAFQLPLSNAGTAVQANNTALTVKNAQDQATFKQQMDQDMTDPSKYKQVPAPDGGYNFLAPNGQQISAYDYARVTGKDLGTILKQSQNPIDLGFEQDYKNLQDYINNKINSSKDPNSDAAKQASAVESEVKSNYGIDLAKMPIQDVIAAFQKAYPTVFSGQPNQGAGVSTGQTFIPTQSYATNNALTSGGGIGQ